MNRPGPSAVPGPGKQVLVLVSLIALILVAVGISLSQRGYRERVERVEERTALAAGDAAAWIDDFFASRIAVLESLARTMEMVEVDPPPLQGLLEAAASPDLGLAGLGWVDGEGRLQASSEVSSALLPLDLSHRSYVQQALALGRPWISEAVVGMVSGETRVGLAVPVGRGGPSGGILLASVRVADLVQSLPPGATEAGELAAVDRAGKLVIAGTAVGSLGLPGNEPLLREATEEPQVMIGVGLHGDPDRIIGVARARVPGWTVVLEQDLVEAIGPARARMWGELGILTALAVIGGVAAFQTGRRFDENHRLILRRGHELAAMEALTESLSRSGGVDQVLAAAPDSFGDSFGAVVVVVLAIVGDESSRVRVVGRGLDPHALERLRLRPVDEAGAILDAYQTGEVLVVGRDEHRHLYPGATTLVEEEVAGIVTAGFQSGTVGGGVALVYDAGFPPPREELRLLEAMTGVLGEAMARAAAAERARLASRVFQHALLPRDTLSADLPLQRSHWYLPATDEVGGDWFELYLKGDGRLVVVIGDVVGRGVQAAAVMGQLRSMLRAVVHDADRPRAALERLDQMAGSVPGAGGCTVALLFLDLDTGRLALAVAGHPPPLLSTGEGVIALTEARGIPVGVGEGAARRELAFSLATDDILVLYTDGLVERRGEVIDEGIARLGTALDANRARGLHTLAEELIRAGPGTTGGGDDVALVCLRRVGPAPPTYSAAHPPRAEAMRDMRRGLHHWLQGKGLSDEAAMDVVMAVASVANTLVGRAERGSQLADLLLDVEPTRGGLAATLYLTTSWPELGWPDFGPWTARVITALGGSASVEGSGLGIKVRLELPLVPGSVLE